ncbi:Uncharacterized conserved protein, DUF58 family, contains vWF domain [Thermomonospora echinospora]|uniref:Uncharacterized conserved protein, DUF58 family, contains vWF domain n=1 Tax=Thermomonospora echinospora TaxID=1992 RepID=A0A1H6CKB0_9ACTN|nr:DUF58 domain-containing protein [Thermomonospora echinospora]SEG73187.1 Uncharacterized conserved protein, DUF58 family, contains vWF domain [Thermomonospora echinospora]
MPTRRGLLVAVAGAVLLAGGLAFGYREPVLLGALALLTVASAVAMVGRPVRLRVRRRIPTVRVTGGTTITVTLEAVVEPSGGTARPDAGTPGRAGRRSLVAAEWIAGPGGRVRRALPDLRGGSGQVSYELAAERRGVLDIGPLEAGRIDPLGLAATVRRHGETTRVWVHPKVHPIRTVPAGLMPDPDGQGDAVQAGGLTFHGLREHVPGDDLRQVHWRSSARHGRLMVREYVDTSRPRIVVLVDERAAGRDTLDQVAEAAASVLATAVRAGLTCELQLCGGRRADGRAGPSAMLDLLAEMEPAAPGSAGGSAAHPGLARACRLLRMRPAADVAVLIGATLGDADLALFGELRDCYRGLVAGIVGGRPRAAVPGVLLLAGQDAGEFATRWDEVREWR